MPKPLPPSAHRVSKWIVEARQRLATRAEDSPQLAASIDTILRKLEALPPQQVHLRLNDVTVALMHVLHAIPALPESIPWHLNTLGRALRHHPTLAKHLHAMPALVFKGHVRDLMHAAASGDIGANSVMMLARAQLSLRCHSPLLWQRLECHNFLKFPPVGVAVVLNATATAHSTLGHPAPSPAVLRALADAFTAYCGSGELTPRCVAMCLWALGTFQFAPVGRDYAAWRHALARNAHAMNAREVSAVWVGCMKLRWAPEGAAWLQLEEATTRALGGGGGRVEKAGESHAAAASAPGSHVAWDGIGIVSAWMAWSRLGVVPSPDVDRVMVGALAGALPSMHAWNATMALRALATLGRVDATGALAAARARIGELLGEHRSLGAWDAATALFSLACIVAVRHDGRVDLVAAPPAAMPAGEGVAVRSEGPRLARHWGLAEGEVRPRLLDGFTPEHTLPGARSSAPHDDASVAAEASPPDVHASQRGAAAPADAACGGGLGGAPGGGRRLGAQAAAAGRAQRPGGCAEDADDVRLAERVLMHAARLHRKQRPFDKEALRQVRSSSRCSR